MIRPINPPPRVRSSKLLQGIGKQRRSFRKADIVRAIEAARAAGMPVGAIEISLDGGLIKVSGADSRGSEAGDLFEQWQDRL